MGRITETDVEWVKSFYPGLRMAGTNTLYGHLRFGAAYGGKANKKMWVYHHRPHDPSNIPGEHLEDVYKVKIVLEENDPVPQAWEVGGRLKTQAEIMDKPLADLHMFEDESLCLGNPVKIRADMLRNSSISNYFEKWLIPYLYYQSHLEKLGCEPWPGLSHGQIGILEDFANVDGVDFDNNMAEAFSHCQPSLLQKISASKSSRDGYRPNDKCICGSGTKFMRCHSRAWLGYKKLRENLFRKQLLSQ